MNISLGILIILIAVLGYISNWINWRFLNYKLVRLLYFVGSFVHESSHALMCILTGAKIKEFKVFSRQPRVVHLEPKVPLLGIPLISLAPIFFGFLFLFLLNRFLLDDYFLVAEVSNIKDVLLIPFEIFSQINLLEWQSWVMIFLFLNVGAMIGPSFQDLKNFWPVLLLFFFISYSFLLNFGYFILGLIFTNIAIQIVFIFIASLLYFLKKFVRI
jgi:hypothetical protein